MFSFGPAVLQQGRISKSRLHENIQQSLPGAGVLVVTAEVLVGNTGLVEVTAGRVDVKLGVLDLKAGVFVAGIPVCMQ